MTEAPTPPPADPIARFVALLEQAKALPRNILPEPTAFAFRAFFLVAVIVAGIFGGITVSRRILLVQALPPRSRSALC